MDYVGSGWKQRLIERVLGISGRFFYHAVLRPKECWDQKKREKGMNRKLQNRGA